MSNLRFTAVQFSGLRFGVSLVLIGSALAGCSGDPPSVEGGTTGVLRCGSALIGDLELTLYPSTGTSPQPIGFALTDSAGRFALLQPAAAGPLELPDGSYRCTLESAGAPVRIPRTYSNPESTPLKVEFLADQGSLEVQGPDLKLR